MLPSVRRVVSAPSTPLVSSLSSSGPRTAAQVTAGIARPIRHQRRFSSSKPSSSDNGSRDISGQQQSAVPASTSSRSGDAKSNGEKRKRKSKDASERQAAARKLPSVPSTQHLSQEGKSRVLSRFATRNPQEEAFSHANSDQPSVCRPSSRCTAPSPSPTASPRR